MRDLTEKYLSLNREFPNKAGKLRQVIETQKRLITKLSKIKQPDSVKELLVSVAEGYDVSLDILEYMKLTLQGVADDSEALLEGSKIRNSHRMQSEEILMLWDKIKEYDAIRADKGTA